MRFNFQFYTFLVIAMVLSSVIVAPVLGSIGSIGTSFATSTQLGLEGTSGYLSSGSNFFAFSTVIGQGFTFTLNGQSGTDFDLYLYDTYGGSPVARSERTSYPDQITYTSSGGGYYYVEVRRFSGTGWYTLDWSQSPARGTGFSNAYYFFEGGSLHGIEGKTSGGDHYYWSDWSPGQVLRVAIVAGAGTDFDLYIYDSSRSEIGRATGTSYPDAAAFTTSNPTYIRVNRFSGTGEYRLEVHRPRITDWYISPTNVEAGKSFTAYYYVNNPFSHSISVWLGCSIRKDGTVTNDPDDDIQVSVSPGEQWVSRKFDVPSGISTGSYEVAMAIWDQKVGGSMLYQYDTIGWQPGLTISPPVVIQRKLTVSSAHDSPNPGVGDHYYNDGTSVTASVTSPVTEGNTVWTCTGWTGTGSVPSSGSGTLVSFKITQDSSITWNWQPAQYQLTISVSPSSGGTTNPSLGSYWYSPGTSVTVSETPATGYSFDHWDLDGDNVGAGTSYTLPMNAPHRLTAVFSSSIPSVVPNGLPVNLIWRGHAYPAIIASALEEAEWLVGIQLDEAHADYMLMKQDGVSLGRWYIWIYYGGQDAQWGYWSYAAVGHYYFDLGWHLDDLEEAEDKVYSDLTSTALPWTVRSDSYWLNNAGPYSDEYNDGYAQRFYYSEGIAREGSIQWITNPTFATASRSDYDIPNWDPVNYEYDQTGSGGPTKWVPDNDNHFAAWPTDRFVELWSEDMAAVDGYGESARVTYGPFDIDGHQYPYKQPSPLTVSTLDKLVIKAVVAYWKTGDVVTLVPPSWTGIKFDAWFADPAKSDRKLMIEMYFARSGLNLAWAGSELPEILRLGSGARTIYASLDGNELARTLVDDTLDDYMINLWAFTTEVNIIGGSQTYGPGPETYKTAVFIIDLKAIWLRAQPLFGRSSDDKLYAVALDLESTGLTKSATSAFANEIKVTYTPKRMQWANLVQPSGVAIGDFNNDGLNDIAFTQFGFDIVTVYKSDGTTILKQWTGLRGPSGVAIGDFNNDGSNELAFAEGFGRRVTVYKSDGTIVKQWTGLRGPSGVAIGDFNNDGSNELAFTDAADWPPPYLGDVTVYKSDGTIVKQWTGLEAPVWVAIGDYNNDGLNDLAFTQYNPWAPTEGRVTVYKSDGVTILKQWTGLDHPAGVSIGDFNNDGLNEIAFAEGSYSVDPGRVTVYKSDGVTILKQWTGLSSPQGVAIGDLSNDGLNDFAYTETYVGGGGTVTVDIFSRERTPTFKVKAESPVNILVTDPSGRKVGFDASSSQTVNEISGATYSGVGTEPQLITIPFPLQGLYIIDIFGTGLGSYTITIESIAADGSVKDTKTITGATSPGQSDRLSTQLFQDGSLVTPIFGVIPEVPLGTIMASAAMMIALVTYFAIPKWRRKREPPNL